MIVMGGVNKIFIFYQWFVVGDWSMKGWFVSGEIDKFNVMGV